MQGLDRDAADAGGRSEIDPERISRTGALIAPYVRRTPIIALHSGELGLDRGRLTLKLELMQHSGSFKARGAFANLLCREVPAAGVVAASGGNHGAAVAYAAGQLAIAARIFVPEVASPAKVARIQSYGADLVVEGARYADALANSERHVAETGALAVHAYDQVETLVGQGTLGPELEEQAGKLDTLLVAVGGGGLIGGIAAWYRGRINLVGVEPAGAPSLHDALAAGRPVDAPMGSIAADSLAPRRVGRLMFPIAKAYVSRVLLVEDDAIRAAQQSLWQNLRLVTEPGAAVALASLISGAYRAQKDERIGVLICGANTLLDDFPA